MGSRVARRARSRSDPARVPSRPGVRLWSAVLHACLAAGLAGSLAAAAEEGEGAPRAWAAGIRWENDMVADHDRFYTNGAVLSLAHTGRSWADPVFNRLPWGAGRRTVTYGISQLMFTPEDTSRPIPDPADRPYAGVLTFGLGLHVERGERYHGLKLLLGVVGPWAGAGETQRGVHRLLGTSIPQGWDAQIRNEPVANLAYEHRRKYRLLGRQEGWGLEFLPVAGVALGNLFTQAQAGGVVRLGYRIPDDFGITLLRGIGELPPPASRSALGVFVHAGGGGNLVLRDLTLDGNTVKDSPSVDKKLLVPIAVLGLGFGGPRFLATFSYAYTGKEFEGQRGTGQFGALLLNYFF